MAAGPICLPTKLSSTKYSIIRLKVPIGVYTWEKHQNLQERLLSSYFENNGTPLGRINRHLITVTSDASPFLVPVLGLFDFMIPMQ